ncbi:MAG TPA: RQC domain-containing protein [Patescibacteria group bacterium]|nr:RQC domain-containing protein [Patescibacteria group bacterium]
MENIRQTVKRVWGYNAFLPLQEEAIGAVLARQILACVTEMGERFGADYVADVLRGAETARIARMRHDRLDAYGVLRQYPKATVRKSACASSRISASAFWPASVNMETAPQATLRLHPPSPARLLRGADPSLNLDNPTLRVYAPSYA